jgi:nitroreductase
MDFYEVIQKRRSIRKYRTTPIPQDQLQRILESAVLAPTAANKQPFLLVVVKDPRNVLGDVLRQEWALNAPIIIAMFAHHESGWIRQWDETPFASIDCAIAMDHLILAATSEGLATCWVAANDPEMIRNALNVEKDYHFVALTPLGFAGENPPAPRPRKTLDEVVRFAT